MSRSPPLNLAAHALADCSIIALGSILPGHQGVAGTHRTPATRCVETISMPGVLEGIRVLDFGRYIAGPYCAALLAEQGAEVIRIEKREGSEDRFQAPVADTGDGAL